MSGPLGAAIQAPQRDCENGPSTDDQQHQDYFQHPNHSPEHENARGREVVINTEQDGGFIERAAEHFSWLRGCSALVLACGFRPLSIARCD